MSAVAEVRPMARVLEVTEDEYHKIKSLSQSVAKVLLQQSPLHAWTAHPGYGGEANEAAEPDEDEDTDAKDNGKVIHRLLLGKGANIEVISGFDNFKKKAAQELRDAAKAAGRAPMLEKKYDKLLEARDAISGNLALEGVNLHDPEGESEVAIEYYEQGEHGLVACRARLDRVVIPRGPIVELKSIRSADDETCSKHVGTYGYDLQYQSNTRALTALLSVLRPGFTGHIDMLFAFFEIKPPYAVNVKRPSAVMRECGRLQWEQAILLWEQCQRTGRWPAYGGRISELDPPHWYVKKVIGDWEGTDLTDLGLQR